MLIIGIETSGRVGSTALCVDGRTLQSHTFAEGPRQARDIMPAINGLLQRAGVAKTDVGAVAVSEGPGSFTGLRVGVTCAKTLAYALRWKLTGVPSLEVLVQNALPDRFDGCEQACPVQDARRARVYGTLFHSVRGHWQGETGVMLLPPEELARRLPEGTLVFGTGVHKYPDVFGSDRFRQGPLELANGRAEEVARLGARLIAEHGGMSPMQLLPKYYRLTEVQEKGRRESSRVNRPPNTP